MSSLQRFLLDAAEGRFPSVDGGITVVAPDSHVHAVVAFTGHAVIVTDHAASDLVALGADGFGGAHHPTVLLHLAGGARTVGTLDCLLVARGTGGGDGSLVPRPDAGDHPRVRHARSLRADVRVHGDERGLVTLGRGIGGRTELSVEAAEHLQGRGVGTSLVRDGLGLVPGDEPVFAAVSPGNARSLRAFLAAGFVPIGSEQLLAPRSG